MKRAALALLAACGHTRVAVTPAHANAHRVVTYTWFEMSKSDRDEGHIPPKCKRVVLDESVTAVDDDRELAVTAKIIDGDDAKLCGVGRVVTFTAPSEHRHVGMETDGKLDYWTAERLKDLHEHLGEVDGAFSLDHRQMPWSATPTQTEAGYLDYAAGDNYEVHGMSDAHHATSVRLRVRAKDRQLACATSRYHVSGTGEWGEFASDSSAWIEIDYGDGTPRCPID